MRRRGSAFYLVWKHIGFFDYPQLPGNSLRVLVVFGNPGAGKSHTICALAHELVLQGHRVLFKNCEILVQELLIAKRDFELPAALKKLSGYTALIIDDIGYV